MKNRTRKTPRGTTDKWAKLLYEQRQHGRHNGNRIARSEKDDPAKAQFLAELATKRKNSR